MPNGAATSYLFDHAEPGSKIEIDGPFGTAHLRTDIERDIILMAGGSGLSPMVSIARGAAAEGLLADRKLHFFYGCRSEADLFDAEAILAGLGANVHFTAALSDPDPASAWTGATGFLHEVVRDTMGDALKDHEIYFAGPAVMSSAIQKMAHEAGTPMDSLHFDEFY